MTWRLGVAGVALGLPVYGWAVLHDPGHLAGLAILLALGLLIVPNLIVWSVFAGQYAWYALIPKHWRIAYRQVHGREGAKSSYIPARTRAIIYSADRNRCVYRRHRYRPVQVDHIIPWAGGGPTLLYNLRCLCNDCNLLKLNYSRDRDGYEHYRRQVRNRGNLHAARRILAAERRDRLSLLRGLRIAWALGG